MPGALVRWGSANPAAPENGEVYGGRRRSDVHVPMGRSQQQQRCGAGELAGARLLKLVVGRNTARQSGRGSTTHALPVGGLKSTEAKVLTAERQGCIRGRSLQTTGAVQ